MSKTAKVKKSKKKEKVEKRTIRCRDCFMVDSYTVKEDKCRHCNAKIFVIDSV
jgi:DNA-directed RNA polymerase subunit RPC12/RpoP